MQVSGVGAFVPAADNTLKRYAFILRLREGAAEAYEKAHREMWPEMLALLKSAVSTDIRSFVGTSG